MFSVKSLQRHLSLAQQRQFLWTGLVSIMAAAAEVLPIYILLELVRALLTQSEVAGSLWLLLGCYLLKLVLVSSAYGLSHRGAYSFIYDLRCKLLDNLQNVPLEQLRKSGTAELKQGLIQDVEQLETSLAHHSVEGIIALFFPLFLALALWQIHPLLMLAALIPLAFAAWNMHRLALLFQEDQLAYSATIAKLNAAIHAFIRCLPMMRVYQQDSRRFKLFITQQQAYKSLIEKIIIRAAPAWSVFSACVVASVFAVTLQAYALLHLQWIVAADFYLAVFLAMALLRPVLKITRLSSEFDQVMQCWQRLQPWLETTKEAASQTRTLNSKTNLICTQGLDYQIGEHSILHQVDLTIPAVPVTLIVGPSGSGKSVLLQLLAGLRKPTAGEIECDDKEIVLVEQHAHIFNASLSDNLSLGRDMPESAIRQALETVQLAYLPSRFDGGLNATLAYLGNNLSGGERQRLALARALLSDAKILLLDEVIAFSDQRTQQHLLSAIRRNYVEKHLVLVSHCLLPGLTIDHVLVMDSGLLLRQGHYEDVVKDNHFLQTHSAQSKPQTMPLRQMEIGDVE